MPHVRLISSWPTNEFRRTVTDARGKRVQLVFSKDSATEVTDEQWSELQARHGKVLHAGDKPPRDNQPEGDPNDEVTRELAAAGLKLKKKCDKQAAMIAKLTAANAEYAKANEELQAELDAANREIDRLQNDRKPANKKTSGKPNTPAKS